MSIRPCPLGLIVLIGSCVSLIWALPQGAPAEPRPVEPVDASSLDKKVTCGYQGWFRCPGDGSGEGWVHWSRDARRLAPGTLTFEMWPDTSELGKDERFAAPGFSHADGAQAYLFSSDNAATVRRHFAWMREHGIDGAWLQHFVVDLPGGPARARYPSRLRVLEHVRKAAVQTGRVWALAYDVTGMPAAKTFDVLTRDWKKMVDDKVTKDPRYLHHGGLPAVQVWGFYREGNGNSMTLDLANRLIDFFKAAGPYRAYLVGGGDWDWRRGADKEWQAMHRRFDAYMPWNVGNFAEDRKTGVKQASMGWWADDLREHRRQGVRWVPVAYPGFSWDNLKKKPPGTTNVPRRKGEFLWEQFHELARLGVSEVYVAMFDEVDEGTAIFKVLDAPPRQAHFVGLEGMPSDWYLRLVGEGARMLRGQRPVRATIPIKP
jgi:hypothetical protein